MNLVLLVSSIFGFFSVVMGAYINHVLKINLDKHVLDSLMTALHYHELYAVLTITIGIFIYLPISKKLNCILKIASYLFLLGAAIFSFSIYLAVITGNTYFNKLTPTGGIILMLAWGVLVFCALVSNQKIFNLSA